MADNKDKKVLNVPALRFPEFSGEWEKLRLSDFATKITKKNKGNIVKNVLCNSANLGLVPQGNYFDREIANTENTDGYYVICNGDFVYNPRKSTAAPFGPVNIYEGEDAGIISPLYLCFSVHNIFPKFLYYRFKSSAWHSYVYSHGDSGVRFDRVSIKDDVFFDMPIYKPAQDEQIKIATLLQLIDDRISTQNKIIEKLETLIKGIIETVISSQKPNTLIKNCLECNSSTLQESQVAETGTFPVYGATGISGYTEAADINGESILIIKDGSSVGIVKFVTGEYSYIGTLNSLIAKDGYCLKYIYFALQRFSFEPYKTGMAIPHIYFKDYGKAKIYCPSLSLQTLIAQKLSLIENKMEVEKRIILCYQLQKSYLLSRMFI